VTLNWRLRAFLDGAARTFGISGAPLKRDVDDDDPSTLRRVRMRKITAEEEDEDAQW